MNHEWTPIHTNSKGRNCAIIVLLLAIVCSGGNTVAVEKPTPTLNQRAVLPAAQELLEEVRRALPREPMRIIGRLESKSRAGELEQTRNIEMLLKWGAAVPQAEYTIRDTFGRVSKKLTIRWRTGRSPEYEYLQGEPLAEAELPDLSEPLEGLDFSWTDLSLSFLWWPGGRTVGAEKKKGRFCYIVDLPAPGSGESAYAGVRLWIDPEINVLLEAEGYNFAEQRIRRLEVKSFKKVRGVWTIQNIQVKSYPSRHKTTLRVRDVITDP